MVLIDIRRKELVNQAWLYEVTRVDKEGIATDIPNPNGKQWDIAEVYHFIDNCTHPYNLPLKMEDYVMNDYVRFAEDHEKTEKEERRKSARMAAASDLSAIVDK